MSPIRVVHVIARLNIGGPARILDELATHIDPADVETVVVAGSSPPDEAEFPGFGANLEVVRIRALGPNPRPGADVAALAELVRTLRRLQPDVVHTHTAKAGVLGRIAAAAARVPRRVHTFHGHLLAGYFRPTVVAAIVQAEKLLAWRTDRLVAVGTKVRDDLLAAGIGRQDQWVVHRPGLSAPPAGSRAEARRLLGVPDDAEVVVYVGRLARVKRADRLAAAFEKLAAAQPSAVLIVVGDGADGAELRRRLESLGARVRHLGWRDDPGAVYIAADVVVLTSDNEGMPLSLIEAAWASRPVVATGVGGVPEVVEHDKTGVIVDPDPAAIADALARLLAEPETCARMGAAARRVAEARFSAAGMARETTDLYSELMAQAAARRGAGS